MRVWPRRLAPNPAFIPFRVRRPTRRPNRSVIDTAQKVRRGSEGRAPPTQALPPRQFPRRIPILRDARIRPLYGLRPGCRANRIDQLPRTSILNQFAGDNPPEPQLRLPERRLRSANNVRAVWVSTPKLWPSVGETARN